MRFAFSPVGALATRLRLRELRRKSAPNDSVQLCARSRDYFRALALSAFGLQRYSMAQLSRHSVSLSFCASVRLQSAAA